MTNLEHFADTKQITAQGTMHKLCWNWWKNKRNKVETGEKIRTNFAYFGAEI